MLNVRVAGASRPRRGEAACGDQFVVRTSGAQTTIVLADGLGHGPEAEAVAAKAVAAVQDAPSDLPIDDLLCDLHAKLAGSRGAAVTIVRVDAQAGSLEHVGVGNVELAGLTSAAVRPIVTAGVVGRRMRKVPATSYKLHPRDLLVLFTDGLSGGFVLEHFRDVEPEAIANALLAKHGRNDDDATCVVVRV